MKKPRVPGSFVAWGIFCYYSKLDFVSRNHLSWAASLPGAELLPENHVFEETTCPGQLRCLGQFFPEIFSFEQATCPRQLRCLGQNVFSKNGLSRILGLLCAEQDVGNLKTCTFRNSRIPLTRARRRKSQKMNFQELWDSCAQEKTSEI